MKNIPRTKEFNEKLATFMDGIKDLMIRAGRGCHLSYKEGQRYVKIITSTDGIVGRSVYGFVDKTDGAIYRPASWRSPSTKHIRGYIYDCTNGLGAATPWGIRYMRGPGS